MDPTLHSIQWQASPAGHGAGGGDGFSFPFGNREAGERIDPKSSLGGTAVSLLGGAGSTARVATRAGSSQATSAPPRRVVTGRGRERAESNARNNAVDGIPAVRGWPAPGRML